MVITGDKHLYIIDASIFIFRYYFSMPTLWHTGDGRPTETVYGYAGWLIRFLQALQPSNVVACFDESLKSCFRNEIYSGYKSDRVLPDDDLSFQLLACKRITQLLGVATFASERFEADDLIGTFAKYCEQKNIAYTILSRDKDLGQLVYSDKARLWDYPDGSPLRTGDITDNLGVRPEQIPHYLALVGDPGDGIPGVPGVGKKTAVALLQYFSCWREIKNNIDMIETLPIRGARSLMLKVATYRAQVDMALRLSTIVTSVMAVKWQDTNRHDPDKESVLNFAGQLGFPLVFTRKIETLLFNENRCG